MTIQQQLIPSLSSSRWETRGWTLQEELLSMRLLVVTDNQCFWHCGGATWYEDAQLEAPGHLKAILDDRESYMLKLVGSKPAFDRYKDVANAFVRRRLTDEADCKFAAAGILKTLEPELGKFFCGIPERYFDACILWSWPHGQPLEELKRANYFPSWSWATESLPENSTETGTLWSAILSEQFYWDSGTRLVMGVDRFVCSMVAYYRYAEDGLSIKIESGVYQSNLDPLYRKYLEDRQQPLELPPVPRLQFYESVQHDETPQNPRKNGPGQLFRSNNEKTQEIFEGGLLFPSALNYLVGRTVAFFAECAKLHVSYPEVAHSDGSTKLEYLACQVSLGPDGTDALGTVIADCNWGESRPTQIECAVVARHPSSGPHMILPKKSGWFYHALLIQRVMGGETKDSTGSLAKKLGVKLDLDAEIWEKAEREWKLVLLI